MKVLIVGRASEFNKATGSGIPRYMAELYTNIKKIKPKSIEKRAYFSMPYVSKHFPFTNNFSFMLLTMFTNFAGYDLIHNLDPSNMIFNYNVRNVSLVTTVHDFIPILNIKKEVGTFENNANKVKALLLKLNLDLNNYMTALGMYNALRISSGLIANSSQTKNEARELGYKKRIYTINLGLDARFMSELTQQNRNKFKVGYIGGLNYRKNIQLVLKAWKLLNNKHNMELEIWGNRTVESNIMFEHYKSDSSILFKGFAAERDLVQIYDSFNIFVFPSLYEGFGLPILEAQSRGLPVIIYKDGKITKEVRKYCIEAEDEEHMTQIIENIKENGYNEKKKKKATEYARSFTWEKTAKETIRAYQKILTL